MIKIDEKYYITADPHCFILQEKRIKQDGQNKGEEYFENLGCYVSIDSALKGLLKKEIRKYLAKENVCSLEKAINDFQKIEEHVTKVSKNY